MNKNKQGLINYYDSGAEDGGFVVWYENNHYLNKQT